MLHVYADTLVHLCHTGKEALFRALAAYPQEVCVCQPYFTSLLQAHKPSPLITPWNLAVSPLLPCRCSCLS
jgi:hypothetical protein